MLKHFLSTCRFISGIIYTQFYRCAWL